MSDYRKPAAEIERLLLPEGWLDPDAVEHSQRRRLQLALALESRRTGYDVVSVDQIADTAMLSKATLYARFENKQGLLASAVDDFCGIAMSAIEATRESERSWPQVTMSAVSALTASIVQEPMLARLTFVEASAVVAPDDGAPNSDIALLSAILDGVGAANGKASGELDEATRLATLGGMAAPIADRLIRGRSAEIPDLDSSLAYLALNAWFGPEAALKALA